MSRPDCPSPETLRSWLEDRLPEEESVLVDAHTAECRSCESQIKKWTSTPEVTAMLADLAESSWSAEFPAWLSDDDIQFPPGGEPGGLGRFRKFDVRRRIGTGGMGLVFEAFDTSLSRKVALKIPRPLLAASPAFLSQFELEARAAAQVQHPSVLQIHAVHEACESFPFPVLEMEYAAGGPLKNELQTGGAMTIERATEIAVRVAEGLEAIHRKGIVHRDIKPANILLDGEGRAKLSDFGLAFAPTLDVLSGDRTGVAGGTSAYLAPERIAGAKVDARGDIFSLGVVLYEMLTGQRPFVGATPEVLRDHICNHEPIRPSKRRPRVPRELEAITLRCLAKCPVDRYPSARTVADALARFRVRRRKQALAATVVAGIVLVSSAIGIGLRVRHDAAIQDLLVQQSLDLTRLDEDLSIPSLDRMRSRIGLLREFDPDRAAEETQRLVSLRAAAIGRRIQKPDRLDDEQRSALFTAIEAQANMNPSVAKSLREAIESRKPDWQTLADIGPSHWGDLDSAFGPRSVELRDDSIALTVDAKPPASTWTVARFQADHDAKMSVTFRGGTWSAGSRVGLTLFDNQWHAEPIWELAFTPDGTAIVASGRDGGVQFWRLADRRLATWIFEEGKPANRFAFVGNKKMLLGGPTGARLRDLVTNTSYDPGIGTPSDPKVTKLATAADGTIAVGFVDGLIRLNGPNGSKTISAGGAASVQALALSPDGKSLASAGGSGTIQLWNVADGSRGRAISGHAGAVGALVFAPRSGLLSSGGVDGTVRTWEPASGRLLATRQHGNAVRALAIAPDDSALASAGDDATTTLWEPRSARRLGGSLTGHTGSVGALAFSPDGKLLASGSSDSTIRLWDVKSHRTIETIGERKYELLVQAPQPSQGRPGGAVPSPISLAEAIRDGKALGLRILRNGVVLREGPISLSDGDLTIHSSLIGDEVSLGVGDEPPLILREIFPLSLHGEGRFGVIWPSGGRISALKIERRSRAAKPDPDDVAGRLFAKGHFVQARDMYREIASKPGTPRSLVQAATCKAALCDIALGDEKAARESLDAVSNQLDSTAERWPLVAKCQLWRLHLRNNDKEKAEKSFAYLFDNLQFEQIAEYLPIDISHELCRQYSWPSMYRFFREDPRRVEELRTAERVASYFQFPLESRTPIRIHQINALFAAAKGDHDSAIDEAIRLSEDLLRDPAVDSWSHIRVFDTYHWILLNQGRDEELRDILDDWISRADKPPRPEFTPLRIFRSRALAALANRPGQDGPALRKAAELDIETFLKTAAPDDLEHYIYEAKLIQGFLLKARLGEEAAKLAWREGYDRCRKMGKLSSLDASILGSLSNELNASDFLKMLDGVINSIPEPFAPMSVLKGSFYLFSGEIAAALRTMWTTRLGIEYARKIAFKTDISFVDFLGIQVNLSVAEIMRQGAFPESMTPEEEDFVWTTLSEVRAAYSANKLSNETLYQFTFCWFGVNSPNTRQKIVGELPIKTRASLEFILGRRYRQLNRPTEATEFFHRAMQDGKACTSPFIKIFESRVPKKP